MGETKESLEAKVVAKMASGAGAEAIASQKEFFEHRDKGEYLAAAKAAVQGGLEAAGFMFAHPINTIEQMPEMLSAKVDAEKSAFTPSAKAQATQKSR
jgi:hypothetical protein